jgi:hypothetical protein
LRINVLRYGGKIIWKDEISDMRFRNIDAETSMNDARIRGNGTK